MLEYLGRYVHRTALSSSAIVANDEHSVTFRYTDSQTHQRKTMTLPANEFLRRFLQHVPPKGFHRVRSFGLLHPEHRQTLRRLQLLLSPKRAAEAQGTAADSQPTKAALSCPHCRKPSLLLLRLLSVAECIARDNAVDSARPGLARAPPAPRDAVATAGPS